MKIRLLVLSLLTAWLLASCNFSLAADVTPPPGYQPPAEAEVTTQPTSGPLYPLVAPDPAKGAVTYVEKCAPCHGPNGLGDGPQASLLPNPVTALGSPQVAQQAIPAEWYRVVTQGRMDRRMPPFVSLNDRQRWDVVAYALTLSTPEQTIAQGAGLYAEQCAACHGESGRGDGPQAAADMPNFTDQERMAVKSSSMLFQAISTGVEGKMPAFGDKLSEDQRWALAAYVRSLTFAPRSADLAQATPQPGLATPAAGTPLTTTQSVTATALTTINGTVENASGGDVPAGLVVTLHGFDQMSLAITQTTQLKDNGTFAFENIEAPAGRAFLATLEFDKVLYGSDVAQVETPGQPISMTLQVYETTTSQASLTADRLHMFFDLQDEKTLRVGELYVISNNSQKTVIGEGPDQPVLSFILPKGATNLQFQDGALGDRYVETANGFADTVPIRPGAGNYQVLFFYELPYNNRKLEFSRPINLPVQAVVVLVPESGLRISGANLQDGGTRDVEGGSQVHTYTGAAMEAGSTLDLTLTGGAGGGSSSLLPSGSNKDLLIGAGALGVVLMLVGVWLYLRSRSAPLAATSTGNGSARSAQAAAASAAASGEKETKDSLMDAILALDDLYQEGTLPEEAYLKRRAELKERLARLMEEGGAA